MDAGKIHYWADVTDSQWKWMLVTGWINKYK